MNGLTHTVILHLHRVAFLLMVFALVSTAWDIIKFSLARNRLPADTPTTVALPGPGGCRLWHWAFGLDGTAFAVDAISSAMAQNMARAAGLAAVALFMIRGALSSTEPWLVITIPARSSRR